MKKNYLKIIAVVLFCWTALEANAQWAVGAKFGPTWTTADRSYTGRIDETYSPSVGMDAGFLARYNFNDWLAVRADLSIMLRSHRMDRNLNYLDPVYTEYRNFYAMLPVMADFSFGGEKIRGHLLCGGFAGYWLQADQYGKTYWMTDYYVYFSDFDEKREFNREDQRFTAGVVGGIGLSFEATSHETFFLESLYYYDLVSYHKGYTHLNDPRYLNTLSVSIGCYYKF
jgi:hypothetical protein